MYNLFKLVFVYMIAVPLIAAPVQAAENVFDRNGNGRISTREVKKVLNLGDINPEETCLDEYAQRSKNLAIKAGVVPPIAGGVWAGTGFLLASSVTTLAGAILFVAFFAYLVTIPAAIGLVVFEGVSIARLISINKVIRMLAEARGGEGKQLQRFYTRFLKTTRGHNNLSLAQFAEAVVAVDQAGVLCDGSARGNSSNASLKNRLASRRHLLRAVDRHLKTVQ